MTTVYVSIGNSDDKLTQSRWAKFYEMTDQYVRRYADEVYGAWVSESTSLYQNACWGFTISGNENVDKLKDELARIAALHDQDAIAWAYVSDTVMIEANDETY